MKTTYYIRNLQLSTNGNKEIIIYEKSDDQSTWINKIDENLHLLNLVGVKGIIRVEISQQGTMWMKNFRTMKEECALVGTTDFKINHEKKAFWLKEKAYYITPSLQGLNAASLAKEGINILVTDASIDGGKSWVSCIYKEQLIRENVSTIKEPIPVDNCKTTEIAKIPQSTKKTSVPPQKEQQKELSSGAWYWKPLIIAGIIIYILVSFMMCQQEFGSWHSEPIYKSHGKYGE